MSHRHHAEDMGLKRLGIAVAINLLLTVAQVIGGVLAGSLSLIADALHNFSDAAGLLLVALELAVLVAHAKERCRDAVVVDGDDSDDEPAEGLSDAADAAAAKARKRRVESIRKHFDGVVLTETLTERVQQLAIATSNAKRNRVPYRHLLLYGPPGTGKTMVAQRLAKASGMDYALMSGGDVGPLGKDAVTELHALFRWARKSPRGLLLFIDEAEAFLGSRSRNAMSEELRNALNALLYQTGTQSYTYVL